MVANDLQEDRKKFTNAVSHRRQFVHGAVEQFDKYGGFGILRENGRGESGG